VTRTAARIGTYSRSRLRSNGRKWHDCAAVRALGLAADTLVAAVQESHREHHAGAARCIMRRGNLPHTARESFASGA